MEKEVLSDSQGISLIAMLIGGTTSLLTLGIFAKEDFWLAIITSIIIALPFYFIFARLYHIFPGKNLFDIAELCLGKFTGKIIILLYTLFCIEEGTEVLINGGAFLSTTTLLDTPNIILSISLMAVCIWAVKGGIEVFGRWAQMACIPFLGFIVIFILLLIPAMDVNNLLPAFKQGFMPVFWGGYLTFAYPLGEVFTFSIIFSSFRTPKTSYKVYFSGLFLGAMIPLAISTTNVLVLGVEDSATYFHPAFFALRRLSLGNVLQRIEVIASVVYILGTFVKVSTYLFATSKGIAKIFGYDDHRFLVIPAALIIINLSTFYLTDTLKYWSYANKTWIYFAMPFEIFFPIIILIIAEIRKKKLL